MYISPGLLSAAAIAGISLPHSSSALSLGTVFSKRTQKPLESKVTILTPQFFPEHKSERVKISYGPYTVPSMHVNNGMEEFQEETTRLPCTDCLITWMQAGLEYPDGTVADADTGMWLHHTVFSNLNRESPVCPTKKYGDRFFASGNERTPVNICASGTSQAGYYIDPEDNLAMVVELMNMVHQPREAVLVVSFEYIPSVPKGFDKVESYWLDIGGCGSSSFPAKPDAAFEYSSPLWKSNSTGRVVFTASHLHDGGTHTEIFKNGKLVCDSHAVYGSCNDSEFASQDMEHISRITECTNIGSVIPGDEWSITAYYNTSKHQPMTNMDGSLEPIMGISLVYVAESTDDNPDPAPCKVHHRHHHHHRGLNIVLGCGILAGATALVLLWMKIKGKPFTALFVRRRQGILLGDADVKSGGPLLSQGYRDEI